MKNNIKKITTNTDFVASINSHFFEHPTGGVDGIYRHSSKEVLKALQEKTKERKVVCLDPSLHTSNIEVFSDIKQLSKHEILLPAGIDGVIMNLKDKFDLIIPVADCATIAVYNKNKDISGVFHAGYAGVSGNTNGDLGIIANMFEELEKLDSLKNFNFIMSPMAGEYFELPTSYAKMLFGRVFTHYKLDEKNYFTTHREDKTKIYVNLKQIILDIFRTYGVKGNRIKNKTATATNDPTSLYPSFRLYSILKAIADKSNNKGFELVSDNDPYLGLTDNELSLQEKELINSGKTSNYLNDYRLALSLKN